MHMRGSAACKMIKPSRPTSFARPHSICTCVLPHMIICMQAHACGPYLGPSMHGQSCIDGHTVDLVHSHLHQGMHTRKPCMHAFVIYAQSLMRVDLVHTQLHASQCTESPCTQMHTGTTHITHACMHPAHTSHKTQQDCATCACTRIRTCVPHMQALHSFMHDSFIHAWQLGTSTSAGARIPHLTACHLMGPLGMCCATHQPLSMHTLHPMPLPAHA